MSSHLIKHIGAFEKSVSESLNKIVSQRIVERIWKKDHTVWSNNPEEITNRLGWLESSVTTLKSVSEIEDFVESVREEGISQGLLMGMGGSSLAPEVLRFTFGVKPGFVDISVLDSTDPGAVDELAQKLNPSDTLYIVSTKSGGTVETFSFLKFFYNLVVKKLGRERAGNHFLAITDPGSGLETTAKELNFRKIFLNDPDIGGRYSALSLFGIVPAALLGIDTSKLLERAKLESEECRKAESSAVELGAIIGELAMNGKDKVTLISPGKLSFAAAWIEQLIAESTGKNGKGILPVDEESVLQPDYYGHDRMFVYTHLKDDSAMKDSVEKLISAGFPVVELVVEDLYDLGGLFFKWEMATIIAGWRIGIQPFDQPNVESAKILARKMVKSYQEEGNLPELTTHLEENGLKIFRDAEGENLNDVIMRFLRLMSAGDVNGAGRSYVAIQAYTKPSDEVSAALNNLGTEIRKKFAVAVTVGYGPRFLHSTGQLHKGDAGNGQFLQILSVTKKDIPIPDEPGGESSSISFGILISAQALGDREALISAGRHVLSIDAGSDPVRGINLITDALK